MRQDAFRAFEDLLSFEGMTQYGHSTVRTTDLR
jgi:hypothetical protein